MATSLLTAVILGVAVTACGGDGESGPPIAESLYNKHCASCHRNNGEGASAPALVGDEATEYSDEELAVIIADGVESMPAFSSQLTAEEIDMVIDYIRELDADV